MSLGQSNLVASELKTLPVYRGNENGILPINALGLTEVQQDNSGANLAPAGYLAGQVIKVGTDGALVPAKHTANGDDGAIVGVALNDAVGYAYESTNSLASGKLTYMHGSTGVVKVFRWENVKVDGKTAITYAAGDKLYASKNGLLTNKDGLATGVTEAGSTVVGILLAIVDDSTFIVQLRV